MPDSQEGDPGTPHKPALSAKLLVSTCSIHKNDKIMQRMAAKRIKKYLPFYLHLQHNTGFLL